MLDVSEVERTACVETEVQRLKGPLARDAGRMKVAGKSVRSWGLGEARAAGRVWAADRAGIRGVAGKARSGFRREAWATDSEVGVPFRTLRNRISCLREWQIGNPRTELGRHETQSREGSRAGSRQRKNRSRGEREVKAGAAGRGAGRPVGQEVRTDGGRPGPGGQSGYTTIVWAALPAGSWRGGSYSLLHPFLSFPNFWMSLFKFFIVTDTQHNLPS